jgi:hypothetical protein
MYSRITCRRVQDFVAAKAKPVNLGKGRGRGECQSDAAVMTDTTKYTHTKAANVQGKSAMACIVALVDHVCCSWSSEKVSFSFTKLSARLLGLSKPSHYAWS